MFFKRVPFQWLEGIWERKFEGLINYFIHDERRDKWVLGEFLPNCPCVLYLPKQCARFLSRFFLHSLTKLNLKWCKQAMTDACLVICECEACLWMSNSSTWEVSYGVWLLSAEGEEDEVVWGVVVVMRGVVVVVRGVAGLCLGMALGWHRCSVSC